MKKTLIEVVQDYPKTNNDLGFSIYEDTGGTPVILYSELNIHSGQSTGDCLKSHSIPKSFLVVGMELAIMTLFGGYAKAKVTEINGDRARAVSGEMYFPLDYNKDKECWVNSSSVNMRGVTKAVFEVA